MILTLTVNPAIDRNLNADRLAFEDRAYILSAADTAGGRGINASRVIHSFGGKTTAIVAAGGRKAPAFEEMVRSNGFPVELVRIRKDIRTNFTITDRQGLTIKLNEPGGALSRAEITQVQNAVERLLPGAHWLMLCGSLPPGVPPELYPALIAIARKAGVRTLLDTDNEPLAVGIEAGPTVVTPNQQEAERLLNQALITKSQCIDAVVRIRAMGAQAAVLSLGSRGVVASYERQVVEIRPPQVDALCPIGAGDAMGAAIVWAMEQKKPFEDALRWGVAAGTASAQLPGISFASLEQTKQIYDQVDVRPAR